jgi:hypothetical protein
MRRLGTTNGIVGEVFTETAQRLIRYGCTEAQAYTLAKLIKLDRDATDDAVQNAVCSALVSAKQAVDGVAEIEYVAGRRCDMQRRLEGRE